MKFWSKIHQNRILPNSFTEEEEGEEVNEVEESDDDANFIEQWQQMGLMDKTYVNELIDDIDDTIYQSNQKKRSLEDFMELGEPPSDRNNLKHPRKS